MHTSYSTSTPLTHICNVLSQIANDRSGDRNKTISKSQYDVFCNEYIFSAIKGNKFGPAFCAEFGIPDYILLLESNIEKAKSYIAVSGYIRE